MPRLLSLLVLLFAAALPAQPSLPYYGITCTTQDTAFGNFLSAPPAFLNGEAEVKTRFELIFSDEVPAVAQAAMRFAANVWGAYLESEVPVRVEVGWEDREDDRLLASAGPATLFRDFPGSVPDTWYPVALAEAVAGRDLNDPEDADILVNANSTANWYFGTDGRTPRDRIDLASVMLHELGHGLGFLSSVDTINETQLAIGFDGRFIIYDLFLETPSGAPLTDPSVFLNPSPELLVAVINNDLVFSGSRAVTENGGQRVPLFSPSTFDVGSSVSHLNERTYPPGSPNALMTPFLAAGEAAHDPGPITLGLFFDLGWPLSFDVSSRQGAGAQVPLQVFPNPASTVVHVRLPPTLTSGTLILYANSGQPVRRVAVPPGGGGLDIPVTDLAAGLYQLAVVSGQTRFGARVVIR